MMNVRRYLVSIVAIVTVCVAAIPGSAATPKPSSKMMVIQNRFGGPTYQGAPATGVTAALFAAGGGAGSFSMVRAFSSMIGAAQLQTELAKLRTAFGDDEANQFVTIFDFVMDDAWKRLGADNVKIPSPPDLSGDALAKAIVDAGTTDSRYLFSGYLFDRLFSMRVNNDVNSDIDTKFGVLPNTSFHKIATAFFYDIGQQIEGANILLPKQP